MADVETSIVINRPPEEVFDYWADGRRYNEWCPSATKRDVRLVTAEPLGPGSRFRGTFKGAGELEYEIVGYERPRRLSMVTHARIGDLHHTISYEPVEGGTRVTQVGQGQFKGIFRLLKPIMLMAFRRSFRANDLALKRYLEGRAGTGATETASRSQS